MRSPKPRPPAGAFAFNRSRDGLSTPPPVRTVSREPHRAPRARALDARPPGTNRFVLRAAVRPPPYGDGLAMPRDIPVGNGRLLVTYDNRYQIRDVYFPHVGQENHAGAGPCRFGVYADVPAKHKSALAWTTDPAWHIRQRYLRDTLTTSVALDNRELRLALYCNDVVDFHRPILIRKIKVKNLAHHERVVQVVHHQDFNMFGTKMGDTAYFDPELRSIVHYRGKRYLMVTFYASAEQRIDEFATGTSGFHGAEGTWRDAEYGHLQGNPIAQG